MVFKILQHRKILNQLIDLSAGLKKGNQLKKVSYSPSYQADYLKNDTLYCEFLPVHNNYFPSLHLGLILLGG